MANIVTIKSAVESPVKMVREFLNSNPDLRRSEAIRALEAKGVATNTAKTQYQIWYKARKDAATAEPTKTDKAPKK